LAKKIRKKSVLALDRLTTASENLINIVNKGIKKKTREAFPFLPISFFCESLPVQDLIWRLSDRYLFRILKYIYKFQIFRHFYKNSPKDYTSGECFDLYVLFSTRSEERVKNSKTIMGSYSGLARIYTYS